MLQNIGHKILVVLHPQYKVYSEEIKVGLLSKAWKGLKKSVKKIGKRIKKTFKSVMKAVGKLGIVGQIGMMFLMPYAMGALGSLFGTAGKLATWSTKLLGPNSGFLSKALGKTMEMINVGGTWIKNAYTSVSTAISNGMNRVGNFLKTGEFSLSADRSSIFSEGFRDSLDTLPTGENVEKFNLEQEAAAKNVEVKDIVTDSVSTNTEVVPEDPFGQGATGGFGVETGGVTPPSGYETKPYGTTGDLVTKVDEDFNKYKAVKETVEKSDKLTDKFNKLISDVNILDPDSKIRTDIKNFDPYKEVSDKISEGLGRGVFDKARYAITGEPDVPNYYSYTVPNVIGLGSRSSLTLGEIDTFMAPQGNGWQAQSMYYTPHVNAQLNPDDDAFNRYMGEFGYTNASSVLPVESAFRNQYTIY
jgi:hypothetical protein